MAILLKANINTIFNGVSVGAVFVDGGLTYRRIGGYLDMIEYACEYIEIDEDEL